MDRWTRGLLYNEPLHPDDFWKNHDPTKEALLRAGLDPADGPSEDEIQRRLAALRQET